MVIGPHERHERITLGNSTIISRNAETGLTIIQTERHAHPATLELGDDSSLSVGDTVTVIGCPRSEVRGATPAGAYPPKSSVRRIKSLWIDDGVIELDESLNAGYAGGPVLNGDGKLVGILRATEDVPQIQSAVSIRRYLATAKKVELFVEPPTIDFNQMHQVRPFVAEVALPNQAGASPEVELVVQVAGDQRRYPMSVHPTPGASNRKRYVADAVLVPVGQLWLSVEIDSQDGRFRGWIADKELSVGPREFSLAQVRALDFRNKMLPHVHLSPGSVYAIPEGLRDVALRIGGQETKADLSLVDLVTIDPPEDLAIDLEVVVRWDGQELGRKSVRANIQKLPRKLSLRGPVASNQPPTTPDPKPSSTNDLEVRLPSEVGDVVVGGKGRWLVLHHPGIRRISVFDVQTRRIVHDLPSDDHVAMAAGSSKLIVVLPDSNVIQLWNLETGGREAIRPGPDDFQITSVVLGAGCDSPAVLWGYEFGDRIAPRIRLLTTDSFRMTQLTASLPPAAFPSPMPMRASDDGRIVAVSNQLCRLGDPPNVETTRLRISSEVYPDRNGKVLYWRGGVLTLDGDVDPGSPKGEIFLPAHKGDYFVVGSYEKDKPGLALFAREPYRYLGTVSSVHHTSLLSERHLPIDKRIHFIPDANLVISIPSSDDRLVLHPFGVQAATRKLGQP